MARPRAARGWHKVYHARGVVAPYVGPQLAEAIGIDATALLRPYNVNGEYSAIEFGGGLQV